jgi:hypothetical protein
LCQPVVLASGLADPGGTALGLNHVYFTESAGGTVKKVLKSGGPVKLLATGQGSPRGIVTENAVFESTDVWFTNFSTGEVVRYIATSGTLQPMLDTTGPFKSPWGITYLQPIPGVVGGVVVSTYGDGKVALLPSGNVLGNAGAGARAMVSAAAYVYVLNNLTGTISRTLTTGAPGMTLVAHSQTNPIGIAAWGGYIYWTNHAASGVVKQMAVGSYPFSGPFDVAVGQAWPWGVAADGSGIYWTNNGAGTLVRRVGNGTPAVVASGLAGPREIAVDANAVYVITQDALVKWAK